MSPENQKDIKGNLLYEREEITLVYEGPSFDGKMELPKLTSQLQATENVMKELINELYKQKKLSHVEKTKVYLELKKGSFEEIISIAFNHPLTISIVGGSVLALFNKLLNKKGNSSQIDITELSNNYGIINNFNMIIAPLDKGGDRLVINLPSEDKQVISQKDKKIISDNINKIRKQEDTTFEVIEEEFFGNLNSVNVKEGKFGFIQEGTTKIIPAKFDKEPSLEEIKQILAERLKIQARATYNKRGEIKKIEVIDHTIKKRISLDTYFKSP
jgi:hypothetical protein